MADPTFAEPNSFWDWVGKIALGLGGGVFGYLASVGQNKLAAKTADTAAKTAEQAGFVDGYRKLVEDEQKYRGEILARLDATELKLSECDEKHRHCEEEQANIRRELNTLKGQVAVAIVQQKQG